MAIGREFEFLIQWHLTERCNLWCSHWYQERERREELSTDAVRSGLEEIGDMVSALRHAYQSFTLAFCIFRLIFEEVSICKKSTVVGGSDKNQNLTEMKDTD